MNCLKQYRERYGLTQDEAVAEIRKRALARGDIAVPGLDRPALSKHENGHKRPGPYYQQLYSEIYGATPAQLGFRLALPGENGDHEVVDRREFIAGTAGLLATAALPSVPTRRLGNVDVVRLRRSIIHLYEWGNQHGGAGATYEMTTRSFHRLRSLVERTRYDAATGRALRELIGQNAQHAGWLAFDADRHDDARRWWLEAVHWGHLADVDLVGVNAMASMALLASDQRRPQEAIDLARTAQRTVKSPAPLRLKSMLLAREALGHAGGGDARSAHAALHRARDLAEQPRRDDDPYWLDFYGEADFRCHEYRAARLLGDASAAEDAARATVALGDPVAYPRDHALDLVNLADALAQRRKIDEAAAVASQAAAAAADLDSRRVTRGLGAVAQRLAPFSDDPAVGAHLDAVRAALPSSMLA